MRPEDPEALAVLILANAWTIATIRSHGLTHQQLESVFTHSGPITACRDRLQRIAAVRFCR